MIGVVGGGSSREPGRSGAVLVELLHVERRAGIADRIELGAVGAAQSVAAVQKVEPIGGVVRRETDELVGLQFRSGLATPSSHHMPQTSMTTPRRDVFRWRNTFSSQLRPAARSMITRCPSCAAHRSM